MLGRAFAAIIALTFGALLVQCVCGLTWRAFIQLGHLVSGPGLGLLLIVFLIGAAAQLLGRLRRPNGRPARDLVEERFVRQSVRRPSVEVPVQMRPVRPDHDPAINQESEADREEVEDGRP